jgi:hypothetical protein
MPQTDTLRHIRSFDDLVRYLEDELDWPLQEYGFEELTYEYQAEALGLKEDEAAKVRRIHQLRPLQYGQPWGIFFVEFEKKKLPIVVFRRILGTLSIKKRASANKSERIAFQPRDLLFVAAFGQEDHPEIAFAHFHHNLESPGDLPTLRVLGWDDQDTVLKLDHLAGDLQRLKWPDDPADHSAWRLQWTKPFRLRPGQVIKTTKELAAILAQFARKVRRRVEQLLAKEHEEGPLQRLLVALRKGLVHDLTEAQFADMFAQTVAYGLLLQRFGRSHTSLGGLLQLAVGNEFLRDLLNQFLHRTGRRGGLDFDEAGIQEIVDFLDSPDVTIDDVLRDFNNQNPQEDPVIHFYEYFLAEYNPGERKRRGVYYTPRPVVSYIVRSVHELLQTEFGLEDGIASTATWTEMATRTPGLAIPKGTDPSSPFVTILDPATGTATFLFECIEVIHHHLKTKWDKGGLAVMPDLPDAAKTGPPPRAFLDYWQFYVPYALLPRLFGYELQMAPYTIAQLKLALKLGETGYQFAEGDRLRLYLTNSLEPASDLADEMLASLFESLAHEAQAVNRVKRDQHFTLIIGNPPYSPSVSEPPWMMAKLEDWKRGLNETKSDLNREEWKFLRLAQHLCDAAGAGIIGLIINRDFLDGIAKRRMREHLGQSFPLRIVVDLNGDVKGNVADKNVFDIEQGVTIAILSTRHDKPLLNYTSRVGTREQKYADLFAKTPIDAALAPFETTSPYFRWVPFLEKHTALASAEYSEWFQIKETFNIVSSGIQTKRDDLCVAFSREELWNKVSYLHSLDVERARKFFDLGEDGRDWAVSTAKADIAASGPSQNFISPILYRPFDTRFTYWTGRTKGFLAYPRRDVMQHVVGRTNIGMIFNRQVVGEIVSHFGVARVPICHGTFYLGNKGQDYFAPLFVFEEDLLSQGDAGRPNFSRNFLAALRGKLGDETSRLKPEDIFNYIYAIFHCPTYRTRYAEFLKIDFPRLPLTSRLELFSALAELGGELVALHLLESPKVDDFITRFVGTGDNSIPKKPTWKDNAVWINPTQRFEGVPEAVWNFHVGGYQVCEKWLKYRKGRTLSDDDIIHYQRIVVALSETIRLMAEIDKVIDQHGGWPIK